MDPGDGPLPPRNLVLLGAGHTHLHVLREWTSDPVSEVRLTCISEFPVAAYSGMLPGVLARQYAPADMEIDLARLCAFAGARLVVAAPRAIDVSNRRLTFSNRAPIPFDVLSIGIGSIPDRAGTTFASETCLDIKPMQTFLPRLTDVLERLSRRGTERLRVAIVGGGAGGIEIALCLPGFLKSGGWEFRVRIALVQAASDLLPDSGRGLRRRVARVLAERNVEVRLGERVEHVGATAVHTSRGRSISADLVIWAGSAAASPLLLETGQVTDGRGFLLTDSTLRVVSGEPVFAVGDAGTIREARTPKAGVYAVRQGPILWENLHRFFADESLIAYRPQARFLKLLNRGDGRALGEYRGLSLEGRLAWKLKDWIDARFVRRYAVDTPPERMPPPLD
ncbi:MAG: FAD-dependent oxidoreductase [Planctomyces sp.]|nr:FAD-dependent oxidoreductase [Planctomyces sp.]